MESEMEKWIKEKVKGVSCPRCRSEKGVIPICYGEPGEKLIVAAQLEKVMLGGCCPSKERFFCKNCSTQF